MKLTLRGVGFAQTEDGDWVRKDDGKWVPTDPPTWADNPTRTTSAPVTVMADPYTREQSEVVMVIVRRTQYRAVPDYEAEVLVRNGWEYDSLA
jgi:hypothetical protein